MAETLLAPLAWNVPICDPETGFPTPYFMRMLQQWLKEKKATDILAEEAVQGARQIIAGDGLTGGGDLTTDRTLSLDTEWVADWLSTILVEGSNVTIVYNDIDGTITISAAGGGGGGSGAHRYWRVKHTATSGAFVAWSEVTMAVSLSGPDECSGGTPMSDSDFGGLPNTNAYDNNISTHWACNGTGTSSWIGYDFGVGNDKEIVEITLTTRNDISWTQNATAFDVQYSDDGALWITAWSEAGVTWSGPGETQFFSA